MHLEPLGQWHCDECGEIIEKPLHGTLEFRWNREADSKEDFRIVHNGNVGNGRCQIHQLDITLEGVAGAKGLLRLLGAQSADPSWSEAVCRILVPYYEEARAYLDAARADGVEVIRDKLSEEKLKMIINNFGRE